MDFGLQGKGAFVAGASRGIGKAIARVLAQEGVNLVIASRSMPDLEQSAREIEDETGQQVIPMSLDVTNTDQVNQCIADATRQLGGLHILVNSASLPGGSPNAIGPIETVDEDDLLSDFDVKYVGALRCARASIPFLKEQGWAFDCAEFHRYPSRKEAVPTILLPALRSDMEPEAERTKPDMTLCVLREAC